MCSSEHDSTGELRLRIDEFIRSGSGCLEFKVDVPLEKRISHIYGIIFPGFEKYRFYLNFTLARIAEKVDFSPWKVMIYRMIGMKIGKGVFISADVILDPHFPQLITIEDHAIIGWGAKLFTHEYFNNTYRLGRVIIGRGAQVGAFSVVRSGVEFGEMAESSPFSVIYKNVGRHERYMDAKNIRKYIKDNQE